MEWLNGPLVWAIDEWHQPMYLFPRDCPRILLWPTDDTSEEDLARYFHGSSARMVAYIEEKWLPKLQAERLYRYECPEDSFHSLGDAGMWVSREGVRPVQRTVIEDLPKALDNEGAELRTVRFLGSLRNVWETSLHASGIRLRNAEEWDM
jgi:hypothetical protein